MKRPKYIIVLLLFSFVTTLFGQLAKDSKADGDEPKYIGIIGAENTHTIAFGKLFNIDNIFSDFKVRYVWGETDKFASDTMDKGRIPNMVKDPKDMLDKIDALIVDHRHAKYHLEAALPFIKKGIPVFIDKPFCYRASKGKLFLETALKYNAPVTSFSSIAQSRQILDIKKQISQIDKINQVVMSGPVDVESKYGGIFYYGVHIVQQMMNLLGEDIQKVKITKNGKDANATIIYNNGMMVTLLFRHYYSGWDILVETETGFHQLKSFVWDDDPGKGYQDIVTMFRTREKPRSYQSMLNCVSVLEALEKSVKTEQWENIEYQILDSEDMH